MKKSNYFEIIIVLILTSAAVGRIMNTDIREKEIQVNPFMNSYSSYGIIAFEISAFYFLLLSNTFFKKMYLYIYIILIIPLTIYYLSKKTDFSEVKSLFIYTPDIKSIFIHALIFLIMMYIILYK